MDHIEYHHVLPVQIRFNDVDKFGHVNNTVYFGSVNNLGVLTFVLSI
jgi:acyl-CoA thioester hydrolase